MSAKPPIAIGLLRNRVAEQMHPGSPHYALFTEIDQALSELSIEVSTLRKEAFKSAESLARVRADLEHERARASNIALSSER